MTDEHKQFINADGEIELRPPPEYQDKPWHLIKDGDDPPELAFWETTASTSWMPEGPRCMWRLHDETQQYAPDAVQLQGYRYLGPAEWREPGTFDGVREPAPGPIEDYVREAQALLAGKDAEIAALKEALSFAQAANRTLADDCRMVRQPPPMSPVAMPLSNASREATDQRPDPWLRALRGGDGVPR